MDVAASPSAPSGSGSSGRTTGMTSTAVLGSGNQRVGTQPMPGLSSETRPRFPFTLQSLLSNDFRYAVRPWSMRYFYYSTIIHRFRILVVGKVSVVYHTDRRFDCIYHRSETQASLRSSKPFSTWICRFAPGYLRTPASSTYAPCKFQGVTNQYIWENC